MQIYSLIQDLTTVLIFGLRVSYGFYFIDSQISINSLQFIVFYDLQLTRIQYFYCNASFLFAKQKFNHTMFIHFLLKQRGNAVTLVWHQTLHSE